MCELYLRIKGTSRSKWGIGIEAPPAIPEIATYVGGWPKRVSAVQIRPLDHMMLVGPSSMRRYSFISAVVEPTGLSTARTSL